MRFIQCGGIGDPLAALLTWEGIEDKMRGADKALLHRSGCLDGNQRIHECFVDTTTKLAEGLRQPQVGWRGIDWVLAQPPRLPHGKIGAHAMTEICIRGSQGMLEQCQGP